MDRLVENLSNQFIEQGIIAREDASIVQYGLEIMLCTVYSYTSIGLLAWLMGCFWETVCFLIAFLVLRTFAGGYHAASFGKCYLYSIMAYLVFYLLLLMTPPSWYSTISLVALVIAMVVVFLFAPCIHENRWVATEDKHYELISRLICLAAILVLAGGQWISVRFAYAVSLGLLFEAGSLFYAKEAILVRKKSVGGF